MGIPDLREKLDRLEKQDTVCLTHSQIDNGTARVKAPVVIA